MRAVQGHKQGTQLSPLKGSSPILLTRTKQKRRQLCSTAIAEPPLRDAGSARSHRDTSSSEGQQKEHLQAQSSTADAPPYDWLKHWYPVAVVDHLDPRKPHAQQLLGMYMVLWRDSKQKWRCFEDRCPHRLAPLSEGRIEPTDGSLFCNYHGWRFNGDSTCAGIPQLPASQSAALGNSRACAVSYPTREAEGLLWVWPSFGQQAQAEAAAAGYPGMCPDLDSGAVKPLMKGWHVRDFRAHWLSVKENGWTDPSHDSILHDGAGLSRDTAAPLDAVSTEMSPQGFSVTYAQEPPSSDAQSKAEQDGQTQQPRFTFTDVTKMPVGAERRLNMPRDQAMLMPGYFTPLNSHLTRSITIFATPNDKAPLQPLIKRLNMLPAWASHIYLNIVTDADIAIQAGVDRNRRLGQKDNLFVPADSDRGVMALQQWLRKYAGNTLPVPLGEELTLSRRELLDRFHTHTEQCPSCMGAYKTASLVQKLASAASIALLAASAVSMAVRGLVWQTTVLGALTAVSGLLVAGCNWLIKQFTYVDYSHENKHTSKAS